MNCPRSRSSTIEGLNLGMALCPGLASGSCSALATLLHHVSFVYVLLSLPHSLQSPFLAMIFPSPRYNHI